VVYDTTLRDMSRNRLITAHGHVKNHDDCFAAH
jgi:hypothetical protein